ncbi:hypothetical protein D3C87_1041920 [compost metagenome]
MGLQVGGVIGDDPVGGGVSAVEAVLGELGHLVEEIVCNLVFDSMLARAIEEDGALLVHLLFFLLAHGATQKVGLPQRVAREHLGDLHDLLLEDHGAVGVLEDGDQVGMGVLDGFLAVFAVDILVDIAALNRTGAIKRQNGRDVFEVGGLQALDELGHALGLDLEDAHRGAAAQEFIDLGVGEVLGVQVVIDPMTLLDVLQRLGHHRQVSQAQEVHLEQAHHLAVLVLVLGGDALVVLADSLEGNGFGKGIAGDDDAGGVKAGVTDHAFELLAQFEDFGDLHVALGLVVELGAFLGGIREADAQLFGHHLGQAVRVVEVELQHAPHVLDGGLGAQGAVGDDLGDLVAAVLSADVLDHLAAAVDAEVDIDVGHADAFRVEEAFEEQVVLDRVDVGDLEAVGGQRACRGAAAGADLDAVGLGVVDEVPDDQEVRREAHLLDDPELELEALLEFGSDGLEALAEAVPGDLVEVALDGMAGRDVVAWQHDAPEVEDQVALLGDLEGVPEGPGRVVEDLGHLVGGLEVEVRAVVHLPGGIEQALARLNTEQGFVGPHVLGVGEVRVVGGRDLDARAVGEFQ